MGCKITTGVSSSIGSVQLIANLNHSTQLLGGATTPGAFLGAALGSLPT